MKRITARFLCLWLCIVILETIDQQVHAQDLSNKRQVLIEAYQDSIVLDEKSIIESSFSIISAGKPLIRNTDFHLNFMNSILVLDPNGEFTFPIKVSFRVFPFNWKEEQQPAREEAVFLMPSFRKPKDDKTQEEYQSRLSYSGNFSRAISFGNSQDAVLHSAMNLQLSGHLTDEIEIKAAISDNNIPLQPSGTTNNIREFDHVFIELKKADHKLIFGDFTIRADQRSRFVNFSKKQQGAMYSFRNTTSGLSSSYSVSRGRYHEMKFDAEDGNLGPYQLRGANGELYILVLAGSEQVFINGELLTRGIDHDYIIDYNTGELFFTTARFISSEMRIQVNFEYAERSYARSTVNVAADHDFGSTEIFLNIYSEKDNKRNTIDTELNDDIKQALEEGGDETTVFGGGIDSSAFDPDKINYRLSDTIFDGEFYDSIFIYSTNDQKAHYRLKFSYSGPATGDYILSTDPLNGRIYKWTAPVNGIPSGDYIIGEKFFPPTAQQVVSLGVRHKINEKHEITGEASFSTKDYNTFSERSDEDNHGGAIRTTYSNELSIGGSKLKSSIEYELVSRNYNEVERFRQVEYQRNWNLPESIEGDNHTTALNFNLSKSKKYKVAYALGNNRYSGGFNALENKILAEYTLGQVNIFSNHRYLTSKSSDKKSEYYHPTGGIKFYINPAWSTEIKFDNEYNYLSDALTGTILAGSYKLEDYRVRLAKQDSLNNQFDITYALKYNNEITIPGEDFDPLADRSHYINSSGQFLNSKTNNLEWSVHFKNEKSYTDGENGTENISANYYQSRIRYKGNYWDGLISLRTDYELGSGKEFASQLTYIKVEEGKGTHAWIDDGNGIKELDEFVVSPYEDENDHVQLLVKTTESRSINKASVSNTFQLEFDKLKTDVNWFTKSISRISFTSTFKSGRKIFSARDNLVTDIFNPLKSTLADSLLIQYSVSSYQNLYINRKGRLINFELYRRKNSSKNLLNVGFAINDHHTKGIIMKLFPTVSLNSELSYEHSKRSNTSDYLTADPYNISTRAISADLGYIIGRSARIYGGYKFRNSVNTLDLSTSPMSSSQISGGFSIKDRKIGTVQVNVKWASVKYEEAADNESLNFAMLNGYKPGSNILWDARVNRELSKWLLLTLSYNARRTGENAKTIHVGQAKLNVIF